MECALEAVALNPLKPSGERRAGARGAALAALALSLALGGCRGAPPRQETSATPPAHEAEPEWIRQPLSWEKLESIEAWLAGAGSAHGAGLRIEAQLELAEGKLEFSRRDLERGNVPAETLRVRLEAIREGFARLAGEGEASLGQRARARIGEQGALALLGVPGKPGELAIVPRAKWGARAPLAARMDPLKGAWSRITLHHSAESTSNPRGGTLEDSIHTLRLIQAYHMEDKAWSDIGYHYLIDSAGRIFEGRELRWQGAHAGGANGVNNHQNIGICLLGDFAATSPTPAATKSLELLVAKLRARYRIPSSRLLAHKDLVTTACPGPAVTAWIRRQR